MVDNSSAFRRGTQKQHSYYQLAELPEIAPPKEVRMTDRISLLVCFCWMSLVLASKFETANYCKWANENKRITAFPRWKKWSRPFFFWWSWTRHPSKGGRRLTVFGGNSPITTRQFRLIFCACLIASRHDTKMDAKFVGLLHCFVRWCRTKDGCNIDIPCTVLLVLLCRPIVFKFNLQSTASGSADIWLGLSKPQCIFDSTN